MANQDNTQKAIVKLEKVVSAIGPALKQYQMFLPPNVKEAVKELSEALELLKSEP